MRDAKVHAFKRRVVRMKITNETQVFCGDAIAGYCTILHDESIHCQFFAAVSINLVGLSLFVNSISCELKSSLQ
jgi:hypothetical protein